jgi:tRNA threonylcarbamoyladenosine biosynthesis protein TsaE
LKEIVCTSSSPDETRAIAAAIGPALRAADVVLLSGDLGAGKTCFVQGAAEALGVTTRVTSPSFVLVREYEGRRVRIVHVDVYRLDTLQELIDLGYEEIFAPDAVLFIEWGDAVGGLLPESCLEVELQISDDDRRRIVIRPTGDWVARIDDIALERWEVPA